jgi:hypothetical protein
MTLVAMMEAANGIAQNGTTQMLAETTSTMWMVMHFMMDHLVILYSHIFSNMLQHTQYGRGDCFNTFVMAITIIVRL